MEEAEGVGESEGMENTGRTRPYENEQSSNELTEVDAANTGPVWVCIRSFACIL